MKITYDPEVDALYIQLREGPAEDRTDVAKGVTADLDAGGEIVGLEVLGAKARLGAAALASVTLCYLPLSPQEEQVA